MKTRYLLLIFLFPVLVGCHISGNSLNVPKEIIDLSGYSERPFSEYLSNYQSCISSTKIDESPIFRLGVVDRAHFSDSVIVLRDFRMKRLAVISRHDGHGISTIGNLGRAENEYLQISGFDFDVNNDLLVLDARSKKLLKYDGKTFDFIGKQSLDKNFVDIKCLDDGNYILYQYPSTKRKSFQLQMTDDKLQSKKEFLPHLESSDISSIFTTQSFNPSNSSGFYSSDIFVDDVITEINHSGQIIRQYEIDFGKYRIPDGIRSSISMHAAELIKYRSACAPLFISKHILGGRLFNKTALSFFVADRDNEIVYIPTQDLEQMTLIYCDNEIMAFYVNSEINDSVIRSLCPDLNVADYIITIKNAR